MKERLFAAAGALLLAACSLTGCGESAKQEENITSDQMPYGSTVSEDTSRSMTISYDKRFVEDALVEKIYTYYHAIESKDGEALGSVMFPLYHAYQLEEFYGGKVDDQALADSTYDAIREYFGYDFDYSYIEITDMVSKLGESAGRDALALQLDQLANEKGEKPVSDDTQHLCELTLTRHVDKKGSGNKTETPDTLTGETLYAIQYQNEWYLMY